MTAIIHHCRYHNTGIYAV